MYIIPRKNIHRNLRENVYLSMFVMISVFFILQNIRLPNHMKRMDNWVFLNECFDTSTNSLYSFSILQRENMVSLDCGVPQGSLLGPLLFILFINDIQNSSEILSFILFADDSNVFLSHHDPHTLVNILVSELEKLLSWIRANKLSLNLQKTNVWFSVTH